MLTHVTSSYMGSARSQVLPGPEMASNVTQRAVKALFFFFTKMSWQNVKADERG